MEQPITVSRLDNGKSFILQVLEIRQHKDKESFMQREQNPKTDVFLGHALCFQAADKESAWIGRRGKGYFSK